MAEVDRLVQSPTRDEAWLRAFQDALLALRARAEELRPAALAGQATEAQAYLLAGTRLAPYGVGVGDLDAEGLAVELCEVSRRTGQLVHWTAQLLAHLHAEDPDRAEELARILEAALDADPEGSGAEMTHVHCARIAAARQDVARLRDHCDRASALLDRAAPNAQADARVLVAALHAELERLNGRPELALAALRTPGVDDSTVRVDTRLQRELARCRMLQAAGDEAEFDRASAEVRSLARACGAEQETDVLLERARIPFDVVRSIGNVELASEVADALEGLVASPPRPWPAEEESLQQLRFQALLRAERLDDAQALLPRLGDAAGWASLFASRLDRARARHAGIPLAFDEERLLGAYDRFLADWRARPRQATGFAPLHFAQQGQMVSEVVLRGLATRPGTEGVAWALRQVVRSQELGTAEAHTAWSVEDHSPAEVLARVRELAPPDGALLLLLPTVEESHLFVVEAERLEHHVLARFDELHGRCEDLSARCARVPQVGAAVEAFPTAPASELAELLFPPAVRQRMTSWRALTLVGFDQLGVLPAELLALPGGTLLGRELAVATLPSIPLGWGLLDGGRSSDAIAGSVAVVAPTAPNVEPLAFDQAAARRLAAALPGRAPRVVSGADAVSSVLASALREAGLVAIVAHGVKDWGLPRPTGLALSDRRVFADDLPSKVSARVVVLFACGVGAGEPRRGDDARPNLAGALLERGAQAVIVAPTDLEYGSALLMLESLGAALGEGASPAEAARRARVSLAQHRERAHPNFGWVEVLGLGHRPPAGLTGR